MPKSVEVTWEPREATIHTYLGSKRCCSGKKTSVSSLTGLQGMLQKQSRVVKILTGYEFSFVNPEAIAIGSGATDRLQLSGIDITLCPHTKDMAGNRWGAMCNINP